MKSELVPSNGDPPIPIVRDVTVIGRIEGCDIRLDHQGVSKRHCVLVRTDGLLVVRDLASTNGTKVNGQWIRWAALLPNDKLSIAGYKCRIYLGPDSSPSPSERLGRPRNATGAAATQPPEPMFPPPSIPDVIALDDDDLIELVDSDAYPPVGSGPAFSASDPDLPIILD